MGKERIDEINQKITNAECSIKQHQEKISKSKSHVANLRKQLENLEKSLIDAKKRGVDVSDHALCRYFNRVFEYDTEKMKSHIKHCIDPYYKQCGDGKFTVDGIVFVVKNGNVVTTYEK